MKKIALFFLISSFAFAQYGRRDSNRIGIGGGISMMNITSSDIDLESKNGWIAGFHLRGNFYNDFQMSFGMNFTENKFSTQTKTLSGTIKDTELTLSGVQIYILPGYVISKNHFNIELGPVFQINDRFKYSDDDRQNTSVDQPLFTVEKIADISKFNAGIYGGINVGVTNFRLRLGYQQGFTNVFGNVNKSDEFPSGADKLKGNIGQIIAQATIYL
jgi:hypothetical protein